MPYTLPKTVPSTIFRAYDIRGVADEQLSESVVYAIGIAIGNTALDLAQQRIAMARDGRLSSDRLGDALRAGLVESGLEVLDIGVAPTPLLYYATHAFDTGAGVMLTGSHNPKDDNGLKMVLDHQTLRHAQVKALRERIVTNTLRTRPGGHCTQINLIPEYIKRIDQDVKLKRPMKIVVDAGNGVAAAVAGDLYRSLGCEVVELFCEIDGNFPNHHPNPADASNLMDLIQAVKAHDAEIGLAFDGDADRLGLVSAQGEIIWADRQMILFARDVLSRVPGAEIVFDVKCSRLLAQAIEDAGGVATMWKTGHSLVKAKLKETGAELAGEMSGHLFFKERWYGFDDGLYAGARMLEILSQSAHASDQLNVLPNSLNTPEIQRPVDEALKFPIIEHLRNTISIPQGASMSTIDGVRIDGPDGWGLVRASNTTPCLTLRFEADNLEQLDALQSLINSAIDDAIQSLTPE